MAFVINGRAGMNLDRVTAGTTTDGQNAEFKLGTTVTASDGQECVYVQAGAAISTTTNQPFALGIDENYQATKLTKANAVAGYMVAFAPQQIISDNDFFWAIKKGSNFKIKVGASCAADVQLYTTATAGVLDDTSGGSHVPILGLAIITAASASASAGSTVRYAIAFNPVGKPQGTV